MTKLVDELKFYHGYHKNKVNKLLHVIGIPIIVWSMLVFLSATPFLWPVTIFYMSYYIYLDNDLGIITDLFLFVLLILAQDFYFTNKNACLIALGWQAFAWVLQFIGHGYFEHNRPALMDSLVQAFLMAPIFVTAEIAFVCGYKQEIYNRII